MSDKSLVHSLYRVKDGGTPTAKLQKTLQDKKYVENEISVLWHTYVKNNTEKQIVVFTKGRTKYQNYLYEKFNTVL